MTILIYCDYCKKMQPLGVADMRQDTRYWCDLICTECFSVITSLSVEEPDVYFFVKVSNLVQQEPYAGHA